MSTAYELTVNSREARGLLSSSSCPPVRADSMMRQNVQPTDAFR